MLKLEMEPIELFRKIRDASDEIVKGLENNDENAVENGLAKFLLLVVQLDDAIEW